MNDRNDPEVILPGASLWPPDAPRWAEYATTFRPANDSGLLDLMFTKKWQTEVPHHPDDAEPDPFVHFIVKKGWTRIGDGPWNRSAPPSLEFGGPDAPLGSAAEVAAMLREVADVMDGSAD